MQTNWKLSQDGNGASRTTASGDYEFRNVSAIEASELATALPADAVSPNVAILEQITIIELTITPRRLREATLTAAGKTWLSNADAQIAALRATLV